MDEQAHSYSLTVSGIEQLKVIQRDKQIHIPSGQVVNLPMRVQVDPINLDKTGNDIQFKLEALDDPEISITETGRFIGPLIR